MTDYIKREDAIYEIEEMAVQAEKDGFEILANAYRAAETFVYVPPADVVERKRGKWLKGTNEQCSCCDYIKDTREMWFYCPNCGAEMEEEE